MIYFSFLSIKELGDWVQNNLSLFVFILAAVFLFIIYFVAKYKMKKEKKIIKEEIDAPKTEKTFVQGQDVKTQKFEKKENGDE